MQINTPSVANRPGTAYPSTATDFSPVFLVRFVLLDI